MKNYKRFNGRVKIIPSNVAQMNIFEWMYYRRSTIINSINELKDSLISLFFNIINILIIFIYPIIGILAIRKAKKEVKRCNK